MERTARKFTETAQAVTARIDAPSFTAAKRMTREEAEAAGLLVIIGDQEVDDEYIARVKTLSIHPETVKEAGKNLKIVYTPLHGSGKPCFAPHSAGNRYHQCERGQGTGCAPDPNFSTLKVPNPEDPAAFTLAIELANQVGADAIFGTDPDCDRLGVAVMGADAASACSPAIRLAA